jgi:hypothetical protein
MRDQIVAFLSEPSVETYTALRDAFVQLPEFRPEERPDGRVWQLLEEDRTDEAEVLAEAAKRPFLLSPATHVALGAVAKKRGDEYGARMEFDFANNLRWAMLQTGDGTRERPYMVNRVGDAYGILSWKEATPHSVSMIFHKGRPLDVISTPELGPVYFDVSIPMQAYPS